jgi:Na+-transporting NADH:ubiquinone oxidoreductase subunit NqrC
MRRILALVLLIALVCGLLISGMSCTKKAADDKAAASQATDDQGGAKLTPAEKREKQMDDVLEGD